MTRDLKRAVLLPILLAATGGDVRAGHSDARLGPYRIIAELGSGGMGTVYLGEQTEPVLRRAAVKVVRPDERSPELVERFLLERQALAVTEHENIARLYEAGTTADGAPWFAMEYVPGAPVTTWCDERQLGLPARLLLFAEICDAVQHLHDLGIQHRDLKPDNLLVVERAGRPVPKIIDLGLASIAGLDAHTGAAFGTPTHMAPEQFTLPSTEVDDRADVHALGVVLYQLLVGALPFAPVDWSRGGEVEVARAPAPPSARLADAAGVAAARSTTPRGLRRALRRGLDAIAVRAVAPDRDARHASAGALGAAVREHVRRTDARHRAFGLCVVTGIAALASAAAGALVAGLF